MFDESNTKDWQQDGNGVFLLREIPGRWVGTGPDRKPATENEFSLAVHHTDRDRLAETAIARKVADALNGPKWQDDTPTSGDWFVSIHPNWRHAFGLSVQEATVSEFCFHLREGTYPRSNECFAGARWLKRETPTDPFANGG
jgi:hypothetical protein